MKAQPLTGSPREVLGRKVKNLRTSGLIPATIYGKNVKSISIQVKVDEFKKLYEQTGETGLIELTIGKDQRPVLVHTVQTHPISGDFLHIEFHQVDLKEKVKAGVPIEIVGEATAVSEKKGVLLTILDEVEVEALPTDLPEKIDLDVTGLSEVDEELKVSDLKVSGDVTILNDKDQTVVKIGELISKEAEEQAAQEAAQAAASAEETGEAEKAEEEAKEEKVEEQKEAKEEKPEKEEK